MFSMDFRNRLLPAESIGLTQSCHALWLFSVFESANCSKHDFLMKPILSVSRCCFSICYKYIASATFLYGEKISSQICCIVFFSGATLRPNSSCLDLTDFSCLAHSRIV
jgi:hypothetical protein